jgi:threonine aldolase
LEDIRAAIRQDDPHQPTTRLISLENTHNRCGAVAISKEYTEAVGDLAHDRGLKLHIDGARIFNAAVALDVSAAELAAPADSITFCLSKGLSAPVGSVLCGSKGFIQRALRIRKQLGGGMRQAGVLAAAGIVSLETMLDRLQEDHQRAKRLAQGLAGIPGLVLDPGTPHTNMVFLNLEESFPFDAGEVEAQLSDCGVKVDATGPRRFRLVLHTWVDDAGVEKAVSSFQQVFREAMI